MQDVKAPKKIIGKRRALTNLEKAAFNEATNVFNAWEKAFVSICLYTGMRRNEILALTKNDIDFENKVIHVNKTIVCDENHKPTLKQGTKTDAGTRDIPIVDKLRNVLKEYMSQNCKDSNSLLFPTRSGGLYSSGAFEYRWKSILKKVNQFMPENIQTTVTPHYLRHNFATELFYAGVDLKAVQYIMGHSNLNITLQIYTDLKMDTASVADKLNAYIKKNCQSKISQNKI